MTDFVVGKQECGSAAGLQVASLADGYVGAVNIEAFAEGFDDALDVEEVD